MPKDYRHDAQEQQTKAIKIRNAAERDDETRRREKEREGGMKGRRLIGEIESEGPCPTPAQ